MKVLSWLDLMNSFCFSYLPLKTLIITFIILAKLDLSIRIEQQ